MWRKASVVVGLGFALGLLGNSPAFGQRFLSPFREPRLPESVLNLGEEEEDEIETDRDSFTPATTLAGSGRLIIESAYSFIDNRRVAETHSVPELLFRYGLTDRVELRFGTNYEIGGAGNTVSGGLPDELPQEAELEEETIVTYGIKLLLWEQEELRPASTLVLAGRTPVAGVSTATEFVGTYVTGWTFENGWTLDGAIRYDKARFEEDDFNLWAPSVVLKTPLGERWKVHVEYFGIFSDGREDESVIRYISPGAHYLIHRNFEVGARWGWGLSEDASNYFINVGGGVRF